MKWKAACDPGRGGGRGDDRSEGRERLTKQLTVSVLILIVCAVTAEAGTTKAKKEALKLAMETYSSRFSVPSAHSEEAWWRATEWVTSLSIYPMAVWTDSVLQTFRSADPGDPGLHCTVERSENGASANFTADCGVNSPIARGTGKRGTAMLVRYVQTGDPDCLGADYTWSRKASKKCLLECSQDGASCEVKPLTLAFEQQALHPETEPFKIRIDVEEEEPFMSENDVQEAIDAGKAKKKCKRIGLNLWDITGNTNHSISIYTPRAWVEWQSCQAARNDRDVSLTEADVQPVLRVEVYPWILQSVDPSAGNPCSFLRSVVLKDESQRSVLPPQSEEKQTFRKKSKYDWGTYSCVMILAKFSLTDVAALRALSPKSRFVVSVGLGTDEAPYEQFWRVHEQNFKKLP